MFYILIINILTAYQNYCNFVTAYNYVTKCCRRLRDVRVIIVVLVELVQLEQLTHPYAPQCGAWDSSPEASLGEKTRQIYSGARRVSGNTRDYGYSTPPDGAAAEKRRTLPQGKPWGYVSQPRFAGHSTLLSNHTYFNIYTPYTHRRPRRDVRAGVGALRMAEGSLFAGAPFALRGVGLLL